MNAGFYKLVDDSIIYSATKAISSEVTYLVAEHETYDYPLPSGWRYFESVEEAELYFNAELKSMESVVKINGIPQWVSMSRALMVLDSMGKLDQLNAIIENPATPNTIKLAFDHEATITRTSPMVAKLGGMLGLSEAELNNLFIHASKIKI